MDIEGPGLMELVSAVPPILHIRGDETLNEFEESSETGSIVVALDVGEVSIRVSVGRTAPVTGDTFKTVGDFQGSGWVLEASDSIRVDDRKEIAPAPAKGFAIPFFRSVKTVGQLTLITSTGIKCESVDRFRIDDALSLKVRDFKVQNMSAVFPLDSQFSDGTAFSSTVASHLNAASFRCIVPDDNLGLILRKTFDRFHGRQRARVFVDNQFAGWWFEPGEDRIKRWHTSDFGIAPEFTRGKSEVRVTIEPPAGVPLWSVSAMELFALCPKP